MEKLIDRGLDSQFQIAHDSVAALQEALLSGMDMALTQVQGTIRLPPEFSRMILAQLSTVWQRSIFEAAEITQEELERNLKQNFLFDRFVAEYIVRFGRDKARKIIDTTASQVKTRVRQSQAEGKSFLQSVQELADELPKIAKVRAKIILATETHAASQYSSQRTAENSGLSLKKVWNSIVDDRTRRFGTLGRNDAFDHLGMNQTSVALTQSFPVPMKAGGIERIYFPGDPNGSAGNIINCRCMQTYTRA